MSIFMQICNSLIVGCEKLCLRVHRDGRMYEIYLPEPRETIHPQIRYPDRGQRYTYPHFRRIWQAVSTS